MYPLFLLRMYDWGHPLYLYFGRRDGHGHHNEWVMFYKDAHTEIYIYLLMGRERAISAKGVRHLVWAEGLDNFAGGEWWPNRVGGCHSRCDLWQKGPAAPPPTLKHLKLRPFFGEYDSRLLFFFVLVSTIKSKRVCGITKKRGT